VTPDENDEAGRRKVIGRTVLRPREQVEQTIKAAILSGELKSGEILPPEAELARQFKVSRTTLREALRVLSTQNLIMKVPGAPGPLATSSSSRSRIC
jgi:GntR family transcriptional repressor for pyruvate dehydrogenase complex